jgi:hypothetical protein
MFYLIIYFLVGLGFELRASHLHSRHSTAWVPLPVYFSLIIWEMGGLSNYLLRLDLNHDLPCSQPPKWLELQVWAPGTQLLFNFYNIPERFSSSVPFFNGKTEVQQD